MNYSLLNTTLLCKKSNTTYVIVVEKQEWVSMAFHLEVEDEGQYVEVLCFIFPVLFLIRQINRYLFRIQHELNILIALGIQQTTRLSLWPQGAYVRYTHIADGNVRQKTAYRTEKMHRILKTLYGATTSQAIY